MTALLAVAGLSVRIGGLVALADLSFEVDSGRIVSLIGPNGAGKTTAFNAITGFMRPSGGSVLYDGRDLTRLSPDRIARLGLVRTFQRTSVFGGCTVFDNILTALHLRGRTETWSALLRLPAFGREERRLREEAEEILAFVGLGARRATAASHLAYGEQRLLGIAVALAATPRLLLLDEPAAGLNPADTELFMTLVERIRGRGVTVLLVEHDMRMVMAISDRVVVLNQGRVIADGRPDQVRGDPEVIRAYLGEGGRRAAG